MIIIVIVTSLPIVLLFSFMSITVIDIIRRIAAVAILSSSAQSTSCSFSSGVHGPEVLLRGYKKPQVAEEPFSLHQFRDVGCLWFCAEAGFCRDLGMAHRNIWIFLLSDMAARNRWKLEAQRGTFEFEGVCGLRARDQALTVEG